MPDLDRIGFVVGLGSKPTAAEVVYVLTNVAGDGNAWRVWAPSRDRRARQRDSAKEYTNRLLVLLYHAFCQARLSDGNVLERGGRKSQAIEIGDNDLIYGPAVQGVYNAISAPEDYKAIPDGLRKGLSPLLVARGRRGKNDYVRVEIAPECHERAFFWNTKNSHFSLRDLDDADKTQRPMILDHVPVSDEDVLDVLARSPYMSRPATARTWQELYIEALSFLAARGTLPSLNLRRDDMPDEQIADEEPHEAIAVLKKATKAIVTGQSGAGKTTLLLKLAAGIGDEWLGNQQQPFPILAYTSLFGPDTNFCLRGTACETAVQIIESVPDNYRYWRGSRGGRRGRLTREQIADAMRKEISQWLSVDNNLRTSTLLLDGYSDVMPKYEYRLAQALTETSSLVSVLVVSSKSEPDSLRQAIPDGDHFSVLPLTIEQVNKAAGDDVRDFLAHGAGYSIRDLAHRPFYLALLMSLQGKGVLGKCVDDVSLIETVIRTRLTDVYGPHAPPLADISPAELDNCLSVIGARLIHNAALSRSHFLTYPTDLAGEHVDFDVAIVVGHRLGLLRRFGPYQERISFEHDLFRDYYGARWLLRHDFAQAGEDRLYSILSYRVWDNAVRMFSHLPHPEGSLERLVFELSKYDPELSAECCRLIGGWTTEDAMRLLRNYEASGLTLEAMPKAAVVVFGQLTTEALVDVFASASPASLEYLVSAEVLAGRDDADRKSLTATLANEIKSIGPEFLANVLTKCRDKEIVECVLSAYDRLYGDAAAVWLYPRLLQHGFDLETAIYLCSRVKSRHIQHAVYMAAKPTREQVDRLLKDPDGELRLIAAIKRAAWDDCATFRSTFAASDPSVLLDNALFFYMNIWARFDPSMEPTLLGWAQTLLKQQTGHGSTGSMELADRLLSVVATLPTPAACKWMAEALPGLPADIVAELLNNLSDNKSRSLICDELRHQKYVRAPFIRYALGDTLSAEECNGVKSQLKARTDVSLHYGQQDAELELMLRCFAKRFPPAPEFAQYQLSLDDVGKVAPNSVADVSAYVLKVRLLDLLKEGRFEKASLLFLSSEADKETAQSFISILHHAKADRQAILKFLWDSIFRLQAGNGADPFRVTGLIEALEIDVGRRSMPERKKRFEADIRE